MRMVGFSTGALAYADYRLGVAMLQGKAVDAIELSALRQPELAPLCEGVDALDLTQFAYVAVHAPSKVRRDDEPQVVETLARLAERGWNIVHHPDAIHDFSLWARLGERLLIENMDKRKPIGRTAAELADVFQRLPDASFCFDIGHARQVDPTMTVAYFLLKEFGDKLKQLHVSEVNSRSTHDRLSYASLLAFREVADMVPEEVPLILETPVPESRIIDEIRMAASAMNAAEQELATAGD